MNKFRLDVMDFGNIKRRKFPKESPISDAKRKKNINGTKMYNIYSALDIIKVIHVDYLSLIQIK